MFFLKKEEKPVIPRKNKDKGIKNYLPAEACIIIFPLRSPKVLVKLDL
jgi:hypothetical protein